ncbi:hypothetical protein NEOLEDRAFT_1143261 [Neolentinus lepideus HHB14362 ss-1]|uniref:Transmembrane protein n=1 Tax=Neolentinus lepideus HHB14362 ss-1 TaxID=1314782 RepID=A0A165MMT4_9AGAM|nr:hypothetical protein NEOLEDRAFT_1143261 [Neolentinus lepideus HHB14362 ss-1]
MNYSIDDTNPDISYSSAPGWSVQSPSDSDLHSFLGGTYHAADSDGASFNITFGGSAVYIYGSKGPGHADYDIVYDDTLLQGNSAYAATTAFQQPLFAHVFDTNTSSGSSHFVSLIVRYNSTNQWLDVDYITMTMPGAELSVTMPQPTATSQPWLSPSSAPLQTLSFSPTFLPQPTTSHSSQLPTSSILAILFGTIAGLALLMLVVLYFINRRIPRSGAAAHSRGSSQSYPAGGASYTYSSAPLASPAASQVRFLDSSPDSPYARPPNPHAAPSTITVGSAYSQASATTATWSGLSQPGSPMSELGPPQAPALSPIRFNQSMSSLSSLRSLIVPSSRKRGKHRDADSTRSNFLQV